MSNATADCQFLSSDLLPLSHLPPVLLFSMMSGWPVWVSCHCGVPFQPLVLPSLPTFAGQYEKLRSVSTASNNENISMWSMFFPPYIQNTALDQLLGRKLTLSQPKPGQGGTYFLVLSTLSGTERFFFLFLFLENVMWPPSLLPSYDNLQARSLYFCNCCLIQSNNKNY